MHTPTYFRSAKSACQKNLNAHVKLEISNTVTTLKLEQFVCV